MAARVRLMSLLLAGALCAPGCQLRDGYTSFTVSKGVVRYGSSAQTEPQRFLLLPFAVCLDLIALPISGPWDLAVWIQEGDRLAAGSRCDEARAAYREGREEEAIQRVLRTLMDYPAEPEPAEMLDALIDAARFPNNSQGSLMRKALVDTAVRKLDALLRRWDEDDRDDTDFLIRLRHLREAVRHIRPDHPRLADMTRYLGDV